MRRWLLALATPALLALSVLQGTAAHAEDPPAAPAPAQGAPAQGAPPAAQTFGIQPSSADTPDTRGTFGYAATPGAVVKDHVAVWNYSEQPLTLRLYPADAFNTDSGGYDVLPDGRKSTQAGSWLRTAAESVTLPPRSRQIVPFTLAVPADATPGDHPAGIVAALRAESTDAKGNAITVDQRVGARVNIRVAGDLRAELTVQDTKAVYHPSANPLDSGRTTVSYTVRNTGNVRLGGKQAVRVTNLFGSIATGHTPPDLQELLPGNAVTYRFDVSGVYPTLWGTAGITVDPLAVGNDQDPKLTSTVTKHRFAWIPWTALLILLVAAGLAGRWYLRRRRPAVPAAPPAAPAPAVVAAAVLLAVLAAGQLWSAPTASAAEAPGTLAFDYPAGKDDDPIDLVSSAACPDPASNYVALKITGAGFPAEGYPLTGLVAASVYRPSPNGGFVLPLANTLRVVASQAGAGQLKGEYTVTASCRHKVRPAALKEFTGRLTFTGPGTWTAAEVAPAGSVHAPAPDAGAAGPVPAAKGAATPVAAATDAGVPLYTWISVAAGLLLLGWLAVPRLRRRARRTAEEAAE
ncbi:hypothetical protein ACIRBX_13460 [Kitasatospora sp. NPDC096147]|uniref:hypothetical protein n=1 Tax=Kitasatospora sp. NPDC096147 TaxID=3364093 RepID=UPI0037F12C74